MSRKKFKLDISDICDLWLLLEFAGEDLDQGDHAEEQQREEHQQHTQAHSVLEALTNQNKYQEDIYSNLDCCCVIVSQLTYLVPSISAQYPHPFSPIQSSQSLTL